MATDEQPEQPEQDEQPEADAQPAELMAAGDPGRPERPNRPPPLKPGSSDTDRATVLELARLFGVSPRLLVNPGPAGGPPPARDTAGEDDRAEGDRDPPAGS